MGIFKKFIDSFKPVECQLYEKQQEREKSEQKTIGIVKSMLNSTIGLSMFHPQVYCNQYYVLMDKKSGVDNFIQNQYNPYIWIGTEISGIRHADYFIFNMDFMPEINSIDRTLDFWCPVFKSTIDGIVKLNNMVTHLHVRSIYSPFSKYNQDEYDKKVYSVIEIDIMRSDKVLETDRDRHDMIDYYMRSRCEHQKTIEFNLEQFTKDD